MLAKNIDTIFSWIMMTLGTAVLMPNVLRWFWWRFNGMGYAVGTLIGVAASILVAIGFNEVPIYKTFPILFAISISSSIIATFISTSTDRETLKDFYKKIRPAGFWGPVKKEILVADPAFRKESFFWDFLSGVVAAIGFHSLYLISTYVCTKQWRAVGISILIMAVCATILYFTWYKRLPDKDEDVELTPVADEI